jgi:hypothetical protein
MGDDLTEQEYNAGIAAATAEINAAVPGWERSMIPDSAIQQLVRGVVNAVDAVRAANAAAVTNLPHTPQAVRAPEETSEETT